MAAISTKHRAEAVNLTNTLISQLKPKAKTYDVRDRELKGFLVRVYPSGTMSYRCEYKHGRHVTIGRTNLLTATQARNQAKQLLGDVARGIDPKAVARERELAERQAARAVTLREFLQKEYSPWFKTAHPRTWAATMKDIERSFFADFGDLLLKDITRPMIERWRMKRADMSRVRLQNGKRIKTAIRPSSINRNTEKLSALFNRAVEFEYLEANPMKGMKKLFVPEAERVRYLHEAEYQRLMQALDDREQRIRSEREQANTWRVTRGYTLYPDLRQQAFADHLKPMVLLALGSGIRRGALMRLEWHRHIDLSSEHVVLKLTSDIVKTGQGRQMPLDEKTSEMLRQWHQQQYPQQQGQGWVFPGNKPNSHITSVKKSWQGLLKQANIENFTWHDMRHDYVSQLIMSGTDLNTVRELLMVT